MAMEVVDIGVLEILLDVLLCYVQLHLVII
jgi:hypothetical protein